MVKTIGNPLTWVAQGLAGTVEHVSDNIEHVGSHDPADLTVNRLTTDDLRIALQKGAADFTAVRADVMFLIAIYPIIGLVLAGIGLNADMLPLLFPLAAGFAILGPVAAVGLYEISRRRERGEPAGWSAGFSVIGSPNFGSVLVLGLYLVGIFLAWMLAANFIYVMTLGPEPPTSVGAFLSETFTTAAGWVMIVVGIAVGFCFALVALAISVVSFPLLIHRGVGVPVAVVTSWRVFRENPRVILTWGAIVAGGLVLGTIPAFIGLVFVLPILGHATWHLYRRAVGQPRPVPGV